MSGVQFILSGTIQLYFFRQIDTLESDMPRDIFVNGQHRFVDSVCSFMVRNNSAFWIYIFSRFLFESFLFQVLFRKIFGVFDGFGNNITWPFGNAIVVSIALVLFDRILFLQLQTFCRTFDCHFTNESFSLTIFFLSLNFLQLYWSIIAEMKYFWSTKE